ncbi:hypothetical protein UFOVP315_34 [uncultured Caudovirales phage]|uniref:Uncharacterized protein n=1 Tax=uncultured Caudovirales phage TaxID=2100421 RepID=A0A6J5LYZ0_9CAUD|nr:hypothetical protein UFOVP315_34 [uncultured Caudovirales phage]
MHHLSGAGMGLKSTDFETIPLCEAHHLFGPHSIEEMGSRAWEQMHGSQRDALMATRVQLAITHPGYCVFTGDTTTLNPLEQIARILDTPVGMVQHFVATINQKEKIG